MQLSFLCLMKIFQNLSKKEIRNISLLRLLNYLVIRMGYLHLPESMYPRLLVLCFIFQSYCLLWNQINALKTKLIKSVESASQSIVKVTKCCELFEAELSFGKGCRWLQKSDHNVSLQLTTDMSLNVLYNLSHYNHVIGKAWLVTLH